MKQADIGLIGLAVMGENLVMNMESKGFTVAVYNRTVAKVDSQSFAISAIPHTVAVTVLQDRKPGDKVNLETDIIGKYVEKLLQPQEVPKQSSGITRDFLSKYGF